MARKRSARDEYLLKRYGITEKRYQEILREQGSRCAICHRPPGSRRLAVDHHHKSKQVRGLLCSQCNRALGWWRENYKVMRNGADYIEKWKALRDGTILA